MKDNYECDPVRAKEVAELADQMIAEGYPAADVVRLWKDNGGIFPAIAARMIRYPVIFQADGWDRCDEDDLIFLLCFALKLPPEIRDAYDHQRRVGADACREAVERIRSGCFKSERHLGWRLDETPWIVPRVFQEDFFLSVGDVTKRAMVDYLWSLPRTIRVLFVTQIMLSKALPKEWRERVYLKAFPPCRVSGREFSAEDPQMKVDVFGRTVWMRGTWSGYNRPYKMSYGDVDHGATVEDPDYYPFAVNGKVQEVYAESRFVRKLYAMAELKDHDVVAAGLFEDGQEDDEQLRKFIDTYYDASAPEAFLMMCDMTGIEFSRGLLRLLVKNDMVEALAVFLTDRREEVVREMPIAEVLIHSITHLPPCRSVKIIDRMAKSFPEDIANARDPFGNNLLWYLLANDFRCWDNFSSQWITYAEDAFEVEQLEASLEYAGCDPEHENHLGMSYAAMRRRSGVLNA